MSRRVGLLLAAVLPLAACESGSISPTEVEAEPSLQIVAASTVSSKGRIAFQGTGAGGADIYVMDPDGSGVTNLTNSYLVSEVHPAWSPNGRRIAFVRQSDIWLMDADGGNQTRLTTGSDPTWSPDGTRIAFKKATAAGSAIWVVNVDGSDLTRLTSLYYHDEPAWSPDGTRIAFRREWSLWLMNADGSGQTKLTDVSGNEQPAWSPDGSRIAFVTVRDGGRSLWVMDSDGTDPVQVLYCDYYVPCLHPTWSPDGSRLAYQKHWGDIWVLDLASSGTTPLTASYGFQGEPAWGVVPAEVAAQRVVGLAMRVWQLRADGSLDSRQALTLNLELKYALHALENDRSGVAVYFLGRFAKRVYDLVGAEALSPEEGLPLIEEAREIVAVLLG